MKDMLSAGAGIVFRYLCLFLEKLIDRLRNNEGIGLPFHSYVPMDNIWDTL